MREVLDLIKMAGPGIMIILDYVDYPRSTYVQQLLYYFHTFPSCFPIRVPHPWGFCCWLHCTGSQCYLVVYAHKSSLHMLQHDETYACAICIQVSMLIVYVSLSQNWGPPNPSLSFIFSRRGWESRTNSILSEKPMNCFIIQLSYCGSLTVDGRNPAPIEVGSLSGFFLWFFTSQVVQDVFHQQYDTSSRRPQDGLCCARSFGVPWCPFVLPSLHRKVLAFPNAYGCCCCGAVVAILLWQLLGRKSQSEWPINLVIVLIQDQNKYRALRIETSLPFSLEVWFFVGGVEYCSSERWQVGRPTNLFVLKVLYCIRLCWLQQVTKKM